MPENEGELAQVNYYSHWCFTSLQTNKNQLQEHIQHTHNKALSDFK